MSPPHAGQSRQPINVTRSEGPLDGNDKQMRLVKSFFDARARPGYDRYAGDQLSVERA